VARLSFAVEPPLLQNRVDPQANLYTTLYGTVAA